ncbi:hypothetical protein [Candidatus Amarolinea dominans]|uniref:hypothetical protein n=1 Tax=Candidatus Amarolinea dominans TaxID=3140696 RepID=UPI001D5C7DA5|nr:hypothetical protein [Anaerolineae bacterium]
MSKMYFSGPWCRFLAFASSAQVLLILAPEQGYIILILSVFVEACAFAAVSPLIDKLIVLTIDPKNGRIQSILYVGVILLPAPSGWIAGTLSSINNNLPFLLTIVLLLIGGLALARGPQRAGARANRLLAMVRICAGWLILSIFESIEGDEQWQ